jgi:hypothetical protein
LTEESAQQNASQDSPDAPASPRSSHKRRILARWGIVLVVLIVFIGIPAYIATRPSFLKRFPSMHDDYATWATSTHVEATCQSCHVLPGVLPQSAYRLQMVGVFYRSLLSRSRAPEAFDQPTNEACLKCHNDLRSVSPKGDLKIPHRAHVQILKMKCIQCHTYLVHEKSPTGKNTPPMSACLRCHNGDTAKNTCTACHTNKATPATHKAADWLVVHPDKAVGGDCAKCHRWTEKWCSECHSKRPRTHTADWRSTHGAAVAKHRNCEACHKASFCVGCHGVLPKANLDPSLKLVQ